MIYKIAIKDDKLWGFGSGQDVTFRSGYDTIESFDNEEEFEKRKQELIGS